MESFWKFTIPNYENIPEKLLLDNTPENYFFLRKIGGPTLKLDEEQSVRYLEHVRNKERYLYSLFANPREFATYTKQFYEKELDKYTENELKMDSKEFEFWRKTIKHFDNIPAEAFRIVDQNKGFIPIQRVLNIREGFVPSNKVKYYIFANVEGPEKKIENPEKYLQHIRTITNHLYDLYGNRKNLLKISSEFYDKEKGKYEEKFAKSFLAFRRKKSR